MEHKKAPRVTFHSAESREETAKRIITAVAASLASKALSSSNTQNRQC